MLEKKNKIYINQFGPAVRCKNCNYIFELEENSDPRLLHLMGKNLVITALHVCCKCGQKLTRQNLEDISIKYEKKTRIIKKKILWFTYNKKESYWDCQINSLEN
jgi:DNA-directed RNA polymerase subunit RPC12/RpoP